MEPFRVHLALNLNAPLGRGILQGVADRAGARDDCRFHTVSIDAIRRGAEATPRTGDAILGTITTWMAKRWPGRTRRRVVNTTSGHDVKGAANVTCDNVGIAELACRHLLEKDVEELGFFGPEGTPRAEAFIAAAKQAGREVSVWRGSSGPFPDDDPELAHWLRGLARPAGVLAFNDIAATHLIEQATRADILVPHHVAVMGVDDDLMVTMFSPVPVTTIDPGFRRVGYRAAEVLEAILWGADPPAEPIRVPPVKVIERHSTDFPGEMDEAVVRAARLIRGRACGGLTAGEVVAAVPVSRRVLERRFRAAFGRSLNEEITSVRLAEAARLLTTTRLPVEAVATRVGYGDAKYFSTRFGREMGISPAAYRRREA